MKFRLAKLGYLVPVIVVGFGFSGIVIQDPWPVPEKNAKMANPLKGDAASLAGRNRLQKLLQLEADAASRPILGHRGQDEA